MIDEGEDNPWGPPIRKSLQIIVLLHFGMMRQAKGSHQGIQTLCNLPSACGPAIVSLPEPLITSGDQEGAIEDWDSASEKEGLFSESSPNTV